MFRLLLSLIAFASLSASAQAAPVPLPPDGWTFEIDPGAVSRVTDGTLAYAYADDSSHIVAATPLNRRETAHEVGHVFDWQVLTDTDRAALIPIMGAPTDRDWGDPYGGCEWFADYYAAVSSDDMRRRKRGGWTSGISAPYATITYRRLNRFRWFLLAVGVREQLTSGPI